MLRAALLLSLLAGCPKPVELTTAPAGAFVQQGKRRLGSAPVAVRTGVFRARQVTVKLAGYRTLTFRVTRKMARAGAVEVRLVPEHGGAGTWAPEDVP